MCRSSHLRSRSEDDGSSDREGDGVEEKAEEKEGVAMDDGEDYGVLNVHHVRRDVVGCGADCSENCEGSKMLWHLAAVSLS